MAVKLTSIKANLVREAAGDWIPYPNWPGVALNVSSLHLPAYQVARDLLIQRLTRKYNGGPIPPEVLAAASGKLYVDHILHDWRGFVDDDGEEIPYVPDEAREKLSDPAYRDLVTAVEWCAGKVSQIDVEVLDRDAKNSARPSSGV
ncbi:hypothetical protein [Hyphomicrobium sp. ghe19]|uniref:hypothetical protein n=1 Tax=Hyphomicrobium sp. ghe19 TaxID=2682968 RepID=UPI0013671345|nr:hypothetical protein HYPP_03767 [Hyphomicrobium sp. ghe19]